MRCAPGRSDRCARLRPGLLFSSVGAMMRYALPRSSQLRVTAVVIFALSGVRLKLWCHGDAAGGAWLEASVQKVRRLNLSGDCLIYLGCVLSTSVFLRVQNGCTASPSHDYFSSIICSWPRPKPPIGLILVIISE